MEALNTAWTAASEDLYKATQEAQANAGNAGNADNQGEPKVQDVDYEEVK
jgi:molecular chaperone DnaK